MGASKFTLRLLMYIVKLQSRRSQYFLLLTPACDSSHLNLDSLTIYIFVFAILWLAHGTIFLC